MRFRAWAVKVGLVSAALALSSSALGDAARAIDPSAHSAPAGWSAKSPSVGDDVRAGKPLVIEVFVPLCSDKKGGPCGKHPGAGDADNLEDNLYWGAIFGARRYFERKGLGWTRTELSKGDGFELERATYKRSVSGSRWGAPAPVDVYLVLHAIDGDHNAEALERFRRVAENGGSVTFNGGNGPSEERVHVVGFMGRNPLLVGGSVPREVDLPEPSPSAAAIPSFSLSAHSRETLGPWLSGTGSRALLLARGAVASEAYLLEATARAIAENDSSFNIQKRASKSYGDFQKLRREFAELHFAPYLPKLVTLDKPKS